MKLNKKTTDALSGIDWAMRQMAAVDARADDEFTVEEFLIVYSSELPYTTADSVRHRLTRMVKEGVLTKRKSRIGGHLVNLYQPSPHVPA
jgi:hypothetical protein